MRQAGIIAAAGIVALEQMVARLADDHSNARRLAEGLAQTPGITLDLNRVQTDIVIFELQEIAPSEFCKRLADYGVKMSPIGGQQVRAVTHYGIESSHIEQALAAVAQVMT